MRAGQLHFQDANTRSGEVLLQVEFGFLRAWAGMQPVVLPSNVVLPCNADSCEREASQHMHFLYKRLNPVEVQLRNMDPLVEPQDLLIDMSYGTYDWKCCRAHALNPYANREQ